MLDSEWNSLRTATWLGWQVESNWIDPFLFALYSIIKPLAIAGILVVLYALVTHADFSSPLFAYMYVGNAFYTYVGAVLTGMTFALADDRERYQTLRSIYVAPADVRLYLAGRGVARFVGATASVMITIGVGVMFLHIGLHWATVRWGLLCATFAVGLVMLAMMGLMLSGIALLLPDSSWAMADAVTGALYLFTGAIFPLEVLPVVLRPVGFALPVTYWLELLRRSLGIASATGAFARSGDRGLLGVFVGLTALFSAIALIVFQLCDHAARERGLIERTSGH